MNTMKKTIGTLLIIAGVVGGVMAASREQVYWNLFGASVGIMILGIFLRKITERECGKQVDDAEKSVNEIRSSIDSLLRALEKLSARLPGDGGDPGESVKQIDTLLVRSIPELLSALDHLKHTGGTTEQARIISLVSEGERNLNRAWSALTDGYEAEAKISLSKAHARLEMVSVACAEKITIP